MSSLALALTDNAMPFAATTHTCFQFSLFLSLLSFCAKKRGGELGGAGAFLAITSLTTIASRYLLPIAFPRESPEPIAAILGMLSIVILSTAGMCLALFAMMHLSSFKDRMPVADDESSRKKGDLSSVVNTEAPAVPSDSPTQSVAQNSDDALRTWLAGRLLSFAARDGHRTPRGARVHRQSHRRGAVLGEGDSAEPYEKHLPQA